MLMKMKNKLSSNFTKVYIKLSNKIKDKTGGPGYVDTGIKILIAVVIGALLLAGLYALFGETIMPTLKQRIEDMFNYQG